MVSKLPEDKIAPFPLVVPLVTLKHWTQHQNQQRQTLVGGKKTNCTGTFSLEEIVQQAPWLSCCSHTPGQGAVGAANQHCQSSLTKNGPTKACSP